MWNRRFAALRPAGPRRRAEALAAAWCVSVLAALWGVSGACRLAAQNPRQGVDESRQDRPRGPLVYDPQSVEGRTVRAIHLVGASSEELVLRSLATRNGQPLRAADVQTDLQTLWSQLRLKVRAVLAEKVGEDGVAVTFVILEQRSYDRVVFKGLGHLKESEARDLLALPVGHRVLEFQAQEYRAMLEDRYRSDGYYHARVATDFDDETSTLTLRVDEGPKVTIRHVYFRGNRAFPGAAPLGTYDNLIGSADLESKPAGKILRGGIYSQRVIEDDLNKLRWFYRGRGYRDAEVELAGHRFSKDLTQVDLTFRVIEGKRYRIRSVDVVRMKDGVPDPHPLYDKSDLLALLSAKPGEYYDRELISKDKRAIEKYYGEHGHPPQGRYGAARLPDAFEWFGGAGWDQPREHFDPDKAEIDLVYEVQEGTPKTLHDVVIRGNTQTQDRIVRRKVFVYPGEKLNLSEINRSVAILDSLRYFQDPDTFAGARFELEPVAGKPDEVELGIQVQEGDTGSFRWGAGVSTGAGVQGRIEFTKRNFDLFRLPSSWAPGTVISEVVNSKAFHGGGQELDMFLAPGTEISTFQITFDEPDLFRQHIDTIGMRLQAYRRIRILDSFDSDAKGLNLQLRRNFSEKLQVALGMREETVRVKGVDPNAPGIVFDAEGQTELRSLELRVRHRDQDNYLRPTSGHDLHAYAEVAGGPFGGEESFYKLGVVGRLYVPLYRDARDRAHVLFIQQSFDYGRAYGSSDDLFLTERFYLGGSNLRGFDQRRAGPTQFGRPLGGEALYTSRLEYQFPLIATKFNNSAREVEWVRGVLFNDAGLLGTSLGDPTFRELRTSIGFGLRIHVPVLGVPIALDFGFPLRYEETDDRQTLWFSLSP